MRSVSSVPPMIRISKGTFYRHHPSAVSSSHPNPPLFSNLTFELPGETASPQNWCVVGPSLSGKTTFLQILRGQHLCFPPTARAFPYLATDAVPHKLKTASRAIQYVGFDGERFGGSGLGPATSAYLSARYESRRESTDFSLRDFLLGNTQLNPTKTDGGDGINSALLDRVVADLRLAPLLDLPVAFLSNGQGRRARIARALLTTPEVLLLDEPFMGLDPPTVASLSPLLRSLADRSAPRLVLSARTQDPLPTWVTHLAYLRTDCHVGVMGERETVLEGLKKYVRGVLKGGIKEDDKIPVNALAEMGRVLSERGVEGEGIGKSEVVAMGGGEVGVRQTVDDMPTGEPVVEMDGCRVRYGDKTVLGNWIEQRDGQPKTGLVWTVRRGERWGVFGPNGSGKTTIVSLLCSDHPQTYSLPIRLFGRNRLPEPGSGIPPLTFWDIQSRVGHSSPEIHQHMPRNLTVRQVFESAWADTFRAKPKLDAEAKGKIEAALRWFDHELNPSATTPAMGSAVISGGTSQDGNIDWASDYMFGELSFSAQRILLFIRAIIKNPDIVVLDEAFSGMDDTVRDKCMLFMMCGEEKTLPTGATTSTSSSPLSPSSLTIETRAVESAAAKAGRVKVRGLMDHQALICISHIKEEVPDCVREWLCLPEADSDQPARFGRLRGPLKTDGKQWGEIWGFTGGI